MDLRERGGGTWLAGAMRSRSGYELPRSAVLVRDGKVVRLFIMNGFRVLRQGGQRDGRPEERKRSSGNRHHLLQRGSHRGELCPLARSARGPGRC